MEITIRRKQDNNEIFKKMFFVGKCISNFIY